MEQDAAASTDDLLAAALALAAERGWAAVRMGPLAERAGVPLVEVYRSLPGRPAILNALMRKADEAMLVENDPDWALMPPRDRVLELMMRRFEALGPYREGVRAVAGGAPREPLFALLAACGLKRAMAWLMAAAGVPRAGLRGEVTLRVLGLAYVGAFRVWLDDESEGFASTMAELDRRLQQVEPFARFGDDPDAAPAPA